MRSAKMTSDFEATLKTTKDRMRAEHIQELQMMLLEFEKAKNFLRREIAAKEGLIKTAAQKYIDREPRDIDMHAIEELNVQVVQFERYTEELRVTPQLTCRDSFQTTRSR